MSVTQSANSEKRIRIARPAGSTLVVKWPALEQVLRTLVRLMGGFQLQIDGAESMRTDENGGIQAKLKTGAAGASTQGLDVSDAGIVVPATVLGEMPKIGSTRLDASSPPSLTIPSSGTQYVIITITGTLNVVGSIYVRPTFSSITSVIISVSTTAPTSANLISSTGVFVLLLATFISGVKTAQNGHGPIGGDLCDDQSKTATAILTPTYADA